MNRLKFVCLSDFHLGAPNSILTGARATSGGRIDPCPTQTTATLTALGAALQDFLPALSDPQDLPTLILAGDVLDLGFSPPNVVVMAYQRLLEALFPVGRAPLFAPEIYFLPGNHDHGLWHHAKMEHFLDQVQAAGQKSVPPLLHTTPMMDRPTLNCHLLTGLTARFPHLQNFSVKIAYPTLGFANAQRGVFLHHGHFIESTYRLMSEIGKVLFNQKGDDVDISEIERLNGSWIDFGWCGLGEPGDNSYVLYSLMQDPAALHAFTSGLAERLHTAVARYLPMSGLQEVQKIERAAVRGLFDVVVGRNSELERNSYHRVLSGDSLRGLRWYVDKLCRHHFEREIGRALPEQITFIFGHTHKPFEDQLVLPGHKLPINIMNTGGWVLDTAELAATQGAAMVLIDDELQTASLRLFNSPINGAMNPVQVKGVGGFPDESNPFLGYLREQLGRHLPAWEGFSAAAQRDLALRAQLMQQQFFNPVAAVA